MSNQSIIRETVFKSLPEPVREVISDDAASFAAAIWSGLSNEVEIGQKLVRLHQNFCSLKVVPDEHRTDADRCHLSALLEPLSLKFYKETGRAVTADRLVRVCPHLELKLKIARAFYDLPDHVRGPTVIGEFTIHGLIGSGNEAQVFDARDQDGIVRVLKLARDLGGNRIRLKNEKAVINSLNDGTLGELCPFIIGRTQFHEEDGFIFLEMEKLNGPNLLSAIARGWPPEEVVELGRQLCTAFKFIHERGFFHADISAKNVVLVSTSDGQLFHPVIIDFGLSVPTNVGNQAVNPDRYLGEGTPIYASPEQRCGSPLLVSDECFSIGRLIAFTLVGAEHCDERVLNAALESRREACPGLVDIIYKATASDSGQRFKDMVAMRNALVACQSGLKPRKLRKRPFFVLIAISPAMLVLYFLFAHSTTATNVFHVSPFSKDSSGVESLLKNTGVTSTDAEPPGLATSASSFGQDEVDPDLSDEQRRNTLALSTLIRKNPDSDINWHINPALSSSDLDSIDAIRFGDDPTKLYSVFARMGKESPLINYAGPDPNVLWVSSHAAFYWQLYFRDGTRSAVIEGFSPTSVDTVDETYSELVEAFGKTAFVEKKRSLPARVPRRATAQIWHPKDGAVSTSRQLKTIELEPVEGTATTLQLFRLVRRNYEFTSDVSEDFVEELRQTRRESKNAFVRQLFILSDGRWVWNKNINNDLLYSMEDVQFYPTWMHLKNRQFSDLLSDSDIGQVHRVSDIRDEVFSEEVPHVRSFYVLAHFIDDDSSDYLLFLNANAPEHSAPFPAHSPMVIPASESLSRATIYFDPGNEKTVREMMRNLDRPRPAPVIQ